MSYPQLLSIIGTIPLFSMRTFFPAFLTALFFTHPEIFPGVESAPEAIENGSFLTQNWLLIVLGALSILEFIGDKNTDIRVFLREAEPYLKPACYLLIQLAVLSDGSEEVINHINWAGFNPLIILSVFGSGAVYFLTRIRKKTLDFLNDIDADDNFYIGKLISWCEDSLVLFGFLLLVWAGIFMVICYAIIIGVIILLKKLYDKNSDAQKYACSKCGHKNLPYAIKCSKCKHDNEKLFKIGILGQRKYKFVTDKQAHKLELLSQKRCPVCATKHSNNGVILICPECNTKFFESPNKQEFIKYLDKKFYIVLSISFLIGFIPIVGFVVSASLVSIYLLSPYRKYISRTGTLFTKIVIRILTIIFFIFGSALGFIAAPIYAAIRYYTIRSQFKGIPEIENEKNIKYQEAIKQ